MTRRLLHGAAALLLVGCASLLTACSPTPTLSDPAATGRTLVTQFLTLLSTHEAAGLEQFLADGFQLQRADGTGATKEEYIAKHALVKSFEIGADLVAVQDGDLLTVRWTVATEESVGGTALRKGEAPRISVFVYRDGRWRMVSHANFNLPA